MLLQVPVLSLEGSLRLNKQTFLTDIHKNQAMQATYINRKQDSSYTFIIC